MPDETPVSFLQEHCEHVSHCQSAFQTIILQFASYQFAQLLKNAWLTSYMNPNKGQKNGGTEGEMRMLKNFDVGFKYLRQQFGVRNKSRFF